MIKVKRKNVILRVPDEDKQHYLAKGYEVINDEGEVIESNKLVDNSNELNDKITELETENTELKALVEKLKADLLEVSKAAVAEEEHEKVLLKESAEEKPAGKGNKKK